MEQVKIAIIGLGYVGLPLAVEFGKKFDTVGFDINQVRVDELKRGFDKTLEEKLAAAVVMIETSFNTKNFVNQKVDRKIISSYKRTS